MSRYAEVLETPKRKRGGRRSRLHPEAKALEILARVSARATATSERGWREPRGWLVSMKHKDGTITRTSANTYEDACRTRDLAFRDDPTIECAWVMMRAYTPPRKRS